MFQSTHSMLQHKAVEYPHSELLFQLSQHNYWIVVWMNKLFDSYTCTQVETVITITIGTSKVVPNLLIYIGRFAFSLAQIIRYSHYKQQKHRIVVRVLHIAKKHSSQFWPDRYLLSSDHISNLIPDIYYPSSLANQ